MRKLAVLASGGGDDGGDGSGGVWGAVKGDDNLIRT